MRNQQQSNGDTLSVATVTKVAPLSIQLDGVPFDLEDDDLIVAERLTVHKRTVSIAGGTEQEMSVKSPLKVGDKVIVVIAQDGQLYYVLDKAV